MMVMEELDDSDLKLLRKIRNYKFKRKIDEEEEYDYDC